MIYYICMNWRSGSHLLMSLLQSTGLVQHGHSQEVFYDEYNKLSDAEFLKQCNKIAESQGHPFICSTIPVWQFGSALRYLTLKDIALTRVKFIRLDRRNLIRQAISLLIMQQRNYLLRTGEFITPADKSQFQFSNEEIADKICYFYNQNGQWLNLFEKHRLIPMTVYYEDFMLPEQWGPQVEQILDFLEIPYHSQSIRDTIKTHHTRSNPDIQEHLYQQFLKPLSGWKNN